MRFELTPYRILKWMFILCAAGVTYLAWRHFPIPTNAHYSVAWFVFFATLTELLAVNLADDSQVEVTASSPILWASACVLGPFLAIVMSISATLCAELLGYLLYSLAARRAFRSALPVGLAVKGGFSLSDAPNDLIQRIATMVGRVWEPKIGIGPMKVAECSLHNAAMLTLIAGASGIVYLGVGGNLLTQGMPERPLVEFVLPFLGLTATGILVDIVLYAAVVVVRDPLPGSKRFYATLLRLHLLLIGTVKPLIRAQLFLVLVSLMLSYLYARLGAWGFVLTGLPIVALRDFYRQWVQEQSAYLDTVSTLATYMQHYHPYTRGHLKRVAEMSERLARELRLPADSIRRISHAGLLHDIGKIGVSEEILDKTEKLESAEWERIKSHPTAGADIIAHLDFLEGIVAWIKYHHKWHDGRGYPDTAEDEVIPIEASIIAVADSFDAMTDDREMAATWVCDSCQYTPEDNSRPESCPKCGAPKGRVYRKPKTLDQAIDELRRGAGSQFHPDVVKAFLAMLERDGVHLDVG